MSYTVAEMKHNRILYLYGRKELLEQQIRAAKDEVKACDNEIERLSQHIGYNPGRGQKGGE